MMCVKNPQNKADVDRVIITMYIYDLYNYQTHPVDTSPICTGLKTEDSLFGTVDTHCFKTLTTCFPSLWAIELIWRKHSINLRYWGRATEQAAKSQSCRLSASHAPRLYSSPFN